METGVQCKAQRTNDNRVENQQFVAGEGSHKEWERRPTVKSRDQRMVGEEVAMQALKPLGPTVWVKGSQKPSEQRKSLLHQVNGKDYNRFERLSPSFWGGEGDISGGEK